MPRGWFPERVHIDLRLTDVFDAATLAATLDSIGDIYDGVAVVALDHPRVREAINGLVERGVAVVTLVSDVPSSKRVHYAGIDNSSAGRTAATLMGRFLGGKKGKVGLIAGSLSLRDHIERRFGFEQVLAQEFPHLAILPVLESRDDWQRVEKVTAEMLAAHAKRLLKPYDELEIIGEAVNGADGLEQIDAAPDLIFLDIEMPVLNGFEMLAKLDQST